jgi:hypothetical protein
MLFYILWVGYKGEWIPLQQSVKLSTVLEAKKLMYYENPMLEYFIQVSDRSIY